MAILLKLPISIGDGRVDVFLKWLSLAKACANGAKEFVLDWSKVASISPAGFAILACLFDTFVEQENRVVNIRVPKRFKDLPVVHNLRHVKKYSALPPPALHNFESLTMLLRGETNAIDPAFIERIGEVFSAQLGEDLLYSCTLILNELMQNCVDHSTSERYYIYAGPWHSEFHVGLLDMGATVPAKLEQKYSCENDLKYLELALKKGTSTRRIRTGGFGLYYFFELLKGSGGKLTMISRGAQVRRYFRTRKSQKNILRYPLSGTWCFARFPLGVNR